MVSKFKLFVLLVLAVLTGTLSAGPIPVNNNPVTPAEDVCTLPAPSMLMVTEIGTSWFKATWTPVTGAHQYQIITRDASNGNVLNTTFVPGSINIATVSGLNPGMSVVPEIRSVCYGGELSPGQTIGPTTGIIVIDVVGSSYSPSSRYSNDNCLMQYGFPGGCNITNDGTSTEFSISDGGNNIAYFNAYKNANGYVSIKRENTPFPFSFHNDGDGKYISINYNGTQSVAKISTSVATASGQRRLFRCDLTECDGGNNDNYPIHRVIATGMTQSSLDARNEQEQSFDLANQVSATPNPFTDLLEIQIPFATPENELHLALYDLQGRMMMSQHIANGGPLQTIETGHLPTGVYILRVECAGKAETIKVVKTQ